MIAYEKVFVVWCVCACVWCVVCVCVCVLCVWVCVCVSTWEEFYVLSIEVAVCRVLLDKQFLAKGCDIEKNCSLDDEYI